MGGAGGRQERELVLEEVLLGRRLGGAGFVGGGGGVHVAERLDGVLLCCGRGREGGAVSVGGAGGLQAAAAEDLLARGWGVGGCGGAVGAAEERVREVLLA